MKQCYLDRASRAIADLSQSSDGTWQIHRIDVPVASRGKLIGSALLDRICVEADAEQATLWLLPVATGGLDDDTLILWYQRRMFEWMGEEGRSPMVRRPQ